MGANIRPWWNKTSKPRLVIISFLTILFVLLILITLGYIFNWGWTGLTSYKVSGVQPGKTLWDWLQLLIIPAVIALGGYLFNYSTNRNERRLTVDNQQDATLKEYIDRMSELLLEKRLRKSKAEDEVRMIARVRTMTVLPRLDGKRKGSILQFLHESKLIVNGQSIISLDGADFSNADLRDAYLDNADLRSANFTQADLRDAVLSGANLTYAQLERADLRGVRLDRADLSHAKLNNANLKGTNFLGHANFSDAELKGADLSDADLRGADLDGADLSNAILIDAYLRQADLSNADLCGANLRKARLWDAKLIRTKLEGADLRDTDFKGGDDLEGANLHLADLRRANLKGATITKQQLGQVNWLKGATMPDGSIHP